MHSERYTANMVKGVVNKLNNGEFTFDNLFFDPVCMTSKEFMKSNFLDFLDMVCKNKNNADRLFLAMPSKKKTEESSYLISHWVYGQPEPYCSERADNWYQIVEKLEEICKKHYGCAWGKQKIDKIKFDISTVPAPEKFFPYDDELMDIHKYMKKLAKNRPVYIGDTLIGYCKEYKQSCLTTKWETKYDKFEHEFCPEPDDVDTNLIMFFESAEEIFDRIPKEVNLRVHNARRGYDRVSIGNGTLFYNGGSNLNYKNGIHFIDVKDATILEDRVVLAN